MLPLISALKKKTRHLHSKFTVQRAHSTFICWLKVGESQTLEPLSEGPVAKYLHGREEGRSIDR